MQSQILLVFSFLLAVFPGPAIMLAEETQSRGPDFQVSVQAIAAPEEAEFQIQVTNKTSAPLTLEFPSSQKYEIIIKDSAGKTVFQYSIGRSFLQALQHTTIEPYKSVVWSEKWNYRDKNSRIKSGEYTVHAILKAAKANGAQIGRNAKMSASASFSVPAENPTFRNVKISGEKGNYVISGEARPIAGKFYYTVEDGHKEFIPETAIVQKNKYPDWSSFKISIRLSKEMLPKNATLILNLYERSTKDNTIIHTYPVVLEQF